MSKGFFITGTDTGIGKTVVGCGIIKAFSEKGRSVCPMKPAESGCGTRKGNLFPPDAAALLTSSGTDETLDTINPYRLRNPLAPSVAAEIEGVKIEKRKIISTFRKVAKKYDMTIVEGAGGIMVPVYKKYLYLDLAADLSLPLIIVARPGLGTINHTLLTIEAVRSRGLEVAGIVINYSQKSRKGLAERTNAEVIEKLGRVHVLGTVPYSTEQDSPRLKKVFRSIADSLS